MRIRKKDMICVYICAHMQTTLVEGDIIVQILPECIKEQCRVRIKPYIYLHMHLIPPTEAIFLLKKNSIIGI